MTASRLRRTPRKQSIEEAAQGDASQGSHAAALEAKLPAGVQASLRGASSQERAGTPKRYLTYKLDLLKTLATKIADTHYVQACNIRVRELRVLRLVHDMPGIAATELRHKLVLDKTLLSKNLAELEKRGLIERTTDPRDNRVQRLSLSVTGQQVWSECETIGRKLEAEMFSSMSEQQWQQLHELLDCTMQSLDSWYTTNRSTGHNEVR